MTMNTFESPDTGNGSDASVAVASGLEPIVEHPVVAERVLSVGGNGLGLIGANPAPADASAPTRVPGPGVDVFVAALVEALRTALIGDDQVGGDLVETCFQENVTLLFTDIVGWTHTASRIGPDFADDVRRRHFSILHQAIATSGGTEVKRLGDGDMAVFGTASAALACAVAMQRGVDSDNRVSAHPLGLRIGLSGGEVTREGADYFGDPVIEAARICASASTGKIFATQVVKDMAGRRARYPYRALGRLELKGLPEPLEAFEVGWHPTPEHEPSIQPLGMPGTQSRPDSLICINQPSATSIARLRMEDGHADAAVR
jgi:class 3 adenylate cyclase